MDMKQIIKLENDITFQALHKQVNIFNTLRVLRLESYEIRHSNVLAWLFNPRENHQLKDFMIQKMLEHLLLNEANETNDLLDSVQHLLNNSLTESHVFREVKTDNNRYIDLIIVNQSLKTVILIENKILATESNQQLNDYYTYIHESFAGYTIIPIYLTLDGEKPSNEHYFIFTYEEIEQILHGLIELHHEQISEKTLFFIEDYRHILRERLYEDEDQTMQAIDIYRAHQETVNYLMVKHPTVHLLHQLNTGYEFTFLAKYQDTIQYIHNHGKNILAYSFESFIKQEFTENVLHKAYPTAPKFLPPEWKDIDVTPDYHLGKGLVALFVRTKENRLKLVVELGPIPYDHRLSFLQHLEKIGLSIKNSSKKEGAKFTQFFSLETDINKWDDSDDTDVLEELSGAMKDLYNDPSFVSLRKQVAQFLRNEEVIDDLPNAVEIPEEADDQQTIAKEYFRKWMESMNVPKDCYRITKRKASFTIPLFDAWKEVLGETRINWWWDNGPLLFWMDFQDDSIQFALEVGPIEATKRVDFLERLKEKGITFNKKGLELSSLYTRIFSKKLSYSNNMEQVFHDIYHSSKLQSILTTLENLLNETEKHE